MKSSEFEQVLGDSLFRWVSHPGIEEVRLRMTDAATKVKLTFVLKVLPEYDLDETLDEATEHLTDEHRKIIFVAVSHTDMYFDDV